jgi:opacity protein-like surface antigen
MRNAARGALLPAIAAVALFAAMPAAQADQQETNVQMDNATNWQAARGAGVSGAYAQGSHRDRVYVRHHQYR